MAGQRYVLAWENGNRELGAHWIKDGLGRRAVQEDTLSRLMEPDHVIRVDADGMVHNDVSAVCAPEFYAVVDDDGQYTDDTERDMAEQIRRQGWEPEGGWSYQQGTTAQDYTMNDSEFIGGGLAEHIIQTPGLWVVCEVRTDEDEDDNYAGWAVMHQEVGE